MMGYAKRRHDLALPAEGNALRTGNVAEELKVVSSASSVD